MENTYFCTRPKLAELLISEGCTATLTVNPFTPGRAAWRFAVTPELVEIVTDYYQSIGKPLPPSAAKAFQLLEV